jgi:hypothetical protein
MSKKILLVSTKSLEYAAIPRSAKCENDPQTALLPGGMATLEVISTKTFTSFPVRYHSGGSMELNARILLLAHMVYL